MCDPRLNAQLSWAVLAVLLFAGTASAMDEPQPRAAPVYELEPEVEVPLFVLPGLTVFGLYISPDAGESSCAPVCDPGDLNGLDREFAGTWDVGWKLASDISLASVLGLGAITLFADGGWRGGLADGVVVAESLAVTLAAGLLLKMAVSRPRPYMYGEAASLELREGRDGGQSFPSGHAGLSAALTTSLFAVLRARHPGSPWPWVALGIGTIATGFVGAGRVLSGKHFPTDVIAGVAIGAAIGFMVPALHDRRDVQVAPVACEGGGGLALATGF